MSDTTNQSYQVLARKYRPETFADLVGQDAMVRTLKNAFAAIVTSGTATLETALFKVPQLVCYKSSAVSYAIAKRIVKLDFISLVNLIMGKEVVKELIQGDCSVEQICAELERICETEKRATLLKDYQESFLNLAIKSK